MASVERHLSRSSYAKLSSKTVISKKKGDTLKAKQKQLKRHGLGNRPKATKALMDDKIEILLNKKLLGLSSPQALLNTVWLHNMIHFGFRGCKGLVKKYRGGWAGAFGNVVDKKHMTHPLPSAQK